MTRATQSRVRVRPLLPAPCAPRRAVGLPPCAQRPAPPGGAMTVRCASPSARLGAFSRCSVPASFLLLVNKQGQTRLAQYYEARGRLVRPHTPAPNSRCAARARGGASRLGRRNRAPVPRAQRQAVLHRRAPQLQGVCARCNPSAPETCRRGEFLPRHRWCTGGTRLSSCLLALTATKTRSSCWSWCTRTWRRWTATSAPCASWTSCSISTRCEVAARSRVLAGVTRRTTGALHPGRDGDERCEGVHQAAS